MFLNVWISKFCVVFMIWNWWCCLIECWLLKMVELLMMVIWGRLLLIIGFGWCLVKVGLCFDVVDRIRVDED